MSLLLLRFFAASLVRIGREAERAPFPVATFRKRPAPAADENFVSLLIQHAPCACRAQINFRRPRFSRTLFVAVAFEFSRVVSGLTAGAKSLRNWVRFFDTNRHKRT